MQATKKLLRIQTNNQPPILDVIYHHWIIGISTSPIIHYLLTVCHYSLLGHVYLDNIPILAMLVLKFHDIKAKHSHVHIVYINDKYTVVLIIYIVKKHFVLIQH